MEYFYLLISVCVLTNTTHPHLCFLKLAVKDDAINEKIFAYLQYPFLFINRKLFQSKKEKIYPY